MKTQPTRFTHSDLYSFPLIQEEADRVIDRDTSVVDTDYLTAIATIATRQQEVSCGFTKSFSLNAHCIKMNTIGLRILLLVGALTATCAFVPHHHHRAAAWSVRSPRATPPLPRSSSFLAVLRQQQSTDGRNSTSFSYSDEDISKELFERQAMDQFQKLQQLEELVGGGVQQQLDQDESFVTHTEDTSSLTTTTTTSEVSTSTTENTFLSTIWRARLLLLGAAALYGTNFSIIKVLGDTMPVGISATLRFGLAALATLPWLLAPPKDGSSLWDSLNTENVVEKESSSTTSSAIAANPSTATSTRSAISPPWHNNWWDSVKSLASTTTVGAALAGFEVGMWNSVGYLAQAVGLETTDASKVRTIQYYRVSVCL